MRTKAEQLTAWGYKAEFITPSELAELEPDIDLSVVGDSPIMFCPEEAWLDPVLYAGAMVRAGKKLGRLTLLEETRVVDVLPSNASPARVKTADGAEHEADVVVNCGGRWSDKVAEAADLKIPLDLSTGYLGFTPPVGVGVSHLIASSEIDVRPDGAGRLMIHKREIDDTVPEPDQPDEDHGPQR